MKKIFLGAAAAFAMASPAAHAATGYVGLAYTNTDFDNVHVPPNPADQQIEARGVDGSVAFNASEGLGIAVDASYLKFKDGDDDAISADAHVFAKSDKHLFGAFAGVLDEADTTTWDIGGEGALFLSDGTIGLAVGYANNDDLNLDVWAVNGSGKLFLTDNLSVGGNIGWAQFDAGATADGWLGGVSGEYQFSAFPISLKLGYSHVDGDDVNYADTVTFGVRYNFGGTLRDRNRSGADLQETSSFQGFIPGI